MEQPESVHVCKACHAHTQAISAARGMEGGKAGHQTTLRMESPANTREIPVLTSTQGGWDLVQLATPTPLEGNLPKI